MNIKFTSTLTADDENAAAPVILKAISTLVGLLPIAYRIRIDTVDGRVYQESGAKGAGRPLLDGPHLAEGATFES